VSPCIKTIPFTCQNNCIECLKQTVQGTRGGTANRCCLVGHLCLPVRQRLAPFLTCYFGQSEFNWISPHVLTTTKQRYNNKDTTKIKTTKNHATKKCLTPIRHTKNGSIVHFDHKCFGLHQHPSPASQLWRGKDEHYLILGKWILHDTSHEITRGQQRCYTTLSLLHIIG